MYIFVFCCLFVFFCCFIKKGVLKNVTKFTGRHLYHSLFFNKVAGLCLQHFKKRLWYRCFLWISWNFQEQLFYRTPLDECFWNWQIFLKSENLCWIQWFIFKKKTFQTIEVSLFSRLINDLLNTIPLNVLVNINRIPTGAKHSISTYPFTNFNHKQVSQLQFGYSGWIRACIFYYIWDWFCRLATYLLTKLETNVKSQLSLSEWILGGGSNHSESGRLRPTNYVSQLTTTTYITMLTCCSNIFFLTISPSIEKPLMWLITCPTVRNTTTQQLYRSLRISITTRTFHSFSLKNSRCYQTG